MSGFAVVWNGSMHREDEGAYSLLRGEGYLIREAYLQTKAAQHHQPVCWQRKPRVKKKRESPNYYAKCACGRVMKKTSTRCKVCQVNGRVVVRRSEP